jgi:hypothetical protein
MKFRPFARYARVAFLETASHDLILFYVQQMLKKKVSFNSLLETLFFILDRLCGLVVRVLGYRSGSPGSIPGTTRKKSNGCGTGSTQPREYN